MVDNALYTTDKQNYEGPDSGCVFMTNRLGHPSNCQECKLDECRLITKEYVKDGYK